MFADIKHSLDTLPDEVTKLGWEKLEADYFNFLNEPQKAQPYLTEYIKLKTKADQLQSSMVENDIENYFSSVQKKYDDDILKKQRQLNNLELILFIGFTLFILFVTISNME